MNLRYFDNLNIFLNCNRGRGISVTLLICLLATLFTFQNCSPVKISEVDLAALSATASPTTNSPALETAPTSRTEIIKSASTIASTSEKIRVLLVVDNSPTMKNSQAYLANNLSRLLEFLKSHNVDLLVLSTDLSRNTTYHSNTLSNPEGYDYVHHAQRTINAQIPVFSFNKGASVSEINTKIQSIGTYIKNLGTLGDPAESPLTAVMLALDPTIGFFKQNDRALIYVITDENDNVSLPNYGFLEIDTLTKNKSPICTGVDELGREVITYEPAFLAKYMQYNVSYFEKIERFLENGESAGFTQEARNFSAYSKASCESTAPYYTTGIYSEGKCTQYEGSSGIQMLYGQSLTARCDQYKTNIITDNFISCEAATYESKTYPDQTTRNCAYTQPEVQRKYIMGLTEEDKNEIYGVPQNANYYNAQASLFFNKIKKRMNDLFGSKFLMSVQVHTKTQTCQPATGQSVDTLFENMGKIFDSSNFSRNTICDSESANGDALNLIASQFTNILEKNYPFSLKPNESIRFATLKIGTEKYSLRQNVDFKIENGSFVLLRNDLSTFDQIEILISIAP